MSTTLVATNTGFEKCITDWLLSIVSIQVHSLSNKMLVQKHCCSIMLTKWTNCIPYSSDVSMINWHSLPSSLHYYSLQLQVSYINNYFKLWILFSAGSSRLKHLGVRTVFQIHSKDHKEWIFFGTSFQSFFFFVIASMRLTFPQHMYTHW